MSDELTWQQREALSMLDCVHHIRGTDLQSKRVGMGTLRTLLAAGWATHTQGPMDLSGFYIITDAGRAARSLPTKQTWPKADPRVKLMPPIVASLPSRVATLSQPRPSKSWK